MDLTRERCVPCDRLTKPMDRKEALKYAKLVDGWTIEGRSIYTDIKFKDFKRAMGFINKVAGLAERAGHHPDIYLHSWNRVRLTLSTHVIRGLSLNDFILASRINKLKLQK
ncbi:MAG: 4a-hydroxytetrahydrobiopterin dehydratase [Candidatus Micrarchaeota archaeon]|nr:4a-hydroxytetrahydrobiopterin dehydratase [Candidatus Micrarchaeota archaeon]